jgi:hypothetical protein
MDVAVSTVRRGEADSVCVRSPFGIHAAGRSL